MEKCLCETKEMLSPPICRSRGSSLAKQPVNARQTSFALHQLAHTHNLKVFNMLMDPSGLPPETARTIGLTTEKKG
jgi:hypothetical protein